MPPWGSPLLQSGAHNQRWPTSGPADYITPATWGGGGPPDQSGRQNQDWPTSGPGGYVTPTAWGVSSALQQGAEALVAHKRATWLHNPCRLRESPPLQSRGNTQEWPTKGPAGYVTPAACGVPTPPKQGPQSTVAHKWPGWLHNPCRFGRPHRFKAGDRIRDGPQVGRVAQL